MENSNVVSTPLNSKYSKFIYPALKFLCLLVGIIIIISNLTGHIEYNALIKDGCYTDGKITNIKRDPSTKVTNIYVTYIVDGEFYEACFQNNINYKPGDIVKVIYEEENPSNCALERNTFFIGYLAGSVFLITGIIFIRSSKRAKSNTSFNQANTAMGFNNPRDICNYDITSHQTNQQSYIGTNNYPQNDYSQNNYSQNNYTQSNYTSSNYTQGNYVPNNCTQNNYMPNNSARADIDTTNFYNH